MKIFLVGGVSCDKSDSDFDNQASIVKKTMEQLGGTLAQFKHDLIICSPFEDSADYHAFSGFSDQMDKSPSASSSPSVEFHFPDVLEVGNKIKILKDSSTTTRVIPKSYLFPNLSNSKKALQYSWLLAQINALDNSDLVITLGGRLDGTATLLLRLAEARQKPILPLRYINGAATELYARLEYELKDRLGDKINLLCEKDNIFDLIGELERFSQLKNDSRENFLNSFFISYPRARPNEADYVENILRRRGLVVYRDENDFNPSADTYDEIKQSIYKSDVFIAIWCQEYACSPWCFDEFQIALKREKSKSQQLWIICIDDTRIVPPDARNLLYYKADTRIEVEGCILKLLNNYKK